MKAFLGRFIVPHLFLIFSVAVSVLFLHYRSSFRTIFLYKEKHRILKFEDFETHLYSSLSCRENGEVNRESLEHIRYSPGKGFNLLQDKTIWLIGDSTLLNKAIYISYVLQPSVQGNRSTYTELMRLWRNELTPKKRFNCIRLPDRGEICFFYFMLLNEGLESAEPFLVELQQNIEMHLNFTNRHPDALVLNYGLHGLHMFPHTPNIGPFNFETTLDRIFTYFRTTLPRTKLFYMMTNSVCASNYKDEYANAIMQWYGLEPDLNSGRRQCHKAFLTALQEGKSADPAAYKRLIKTQNESRVAMELCSLMILDDVGAVHFNYQAYNTLRRFSDVRILNAYTLTNGRCNCSGRADGRHYSSLIPIWWEAFLVAFIGFHKVN